MLDKKDLLKIGDANNSYIVIFDESFAFVDCNDFYFNCVKDSFRRGDMENTHLLTFGPNLPNLGYYDDCLRVGRQGGEYIFDEYPLDEALHKKKQTLKILVSKLSDNTIAFIGNDVSETQQVKLQKQTIKRLETAMDIVLERFTKKQYEIKTNYNRNMEELIFPLIEKLRSTQLSERQKIWVEALMQSLNGSDDIFCHPQYLLYRPLNPRELEVASLVKNGQTTKEIAALLNLSIKTVDYHRSNIRKKLAIGKNSPQDLRSGLLSLKDRIQSDANPYHLRN